MKAFRDLMQTLMQTLQWYEERLSGLLKTRNLSLPQYQVLQILCKQYPSPCSNLEIAKDMPDRSSNIGRIADKLIEKGLVIRNLNPHDKRAVQIKPTPKGLQVWKAVEEDLANMQPGIHAFNEEKIKIINEWLHELRNPPSGDAL